MVARVEVNYGGGRSGSSGSNTVLKSLLKEFKNVRSVLDKGFKLGSSGLGGLGGFGSAMGGVGLAGAGILALGGAVFSGTSAEREDFTGYEKANIGGEDKVLAIEQKTGKIIDILSMQEAEQLGILDKNKEVRSDYKAISDAWKDVKDTLPDYKGYITASIDELMKQEALQTDSTKIQEDINQLLTEKKRKLEKEVYGVSFTQENYDSGRLGPFTSMGASKSYYENKNNVVNDFLSNNALVNSHVSGSRIGSSILDSMNNNYRFSDPLASALDLTYTMNVKKEGE